MKENHPRKTVLSLEQLQARLPIALKVNHECRAQLITSLRTLTAELGYGSDVADEANLKSEQTNIQRELNRVSEEESHILDAIQAAHKDTYGYCECCGIAIPLKRMNLAPFTTYCVDCKNSMELRSAQETGHRFPTFTRP